MASNNVQNIKFLRNGSLFGTRDLALQGMNGQLSNLADGTAILGRYGSGNNVKTLVGFVYANGDNKSLTVFDVEGASADVEALRAEINAKLGEGVTSANTVTDQLEALSGNSSTAQSGDTSVEGAKKYADEKISQAVNGLDYDDTAVAGEYVSQVTEADGVIAVTRVALPSLAEVHTEGQPIIAISESNGQIAASAGTINAEHVNVTDSGELFTATTVEAALAEIAAEIDAMDKTASAEDGKVVTTVSETDGVVSETKANVKDLQLGGYSKDTTATGDIASSDTINAALSKLENKAAAITIANADGSINVTTGASGTDINVNIKNGEKVIKLDGEGGGLYTNLNVVKLTEDLPATVKERYELRDSDNVKIGESIDIAKDSHIVSITYISDPSDVHYQNLEYQYIDASGNTQTEYVDVSSLVLEAEFASGVTVTNHIAHGVVDPTSETFLTVGTDGFKLSGVQSAINTAIEGLNVTDDTAVAGQYVAAIEETNGIVAVKTRANVSEAVLNNYSKGSDSGDVVSTDTVNAAISKLENQIDAAEEAAKAAATVIASGSSADTAEHLEIVTTEDETTHAKTYTFDLKDIASQTDLTELSGKTVTAITSDNSSITATIDGAVGNKSYNIETDASKIKMTGFTSTDALSGITSSSSITEAFKEVDNVITENERVTAEALTDLDGRLDVVEGEYISGVSVNGKAVTVANKVAPISITAATSAATPTSTEAIVVDTDANGNITIGLADIDAGVY